jgi:pimeloyl-ACP methyl ester carboxylesterase
MDRIEAPVLLIHGRRDRLVPLTHAEAAAGKHHEWRLRVLEDVGHVPMLEAPARWLEEVEGFLDEAVEQADAISSAS